MDITPESRKRIKKMKVKGVVIEDFVNYKLPAMFIAFPTCTWKCGKQYCQNCQLAKEKDININIENLVEQYCDNPITEAMVCGGLEPFDLWDDLYKLIKVFRKNSKDTIIIYTGYTEEELSSKIQILKNVPNLIIKFGRFIPDQPHHKDELIGVELASPNQYAKVISK